MQWIKLSERKPKREDGNEKGQILYRWSDGSVIIAAWDAQTSGYCTLWARLLDIELPSPPEPEMPKRLEFVKAEDGKIVNGPDELWFNPKTNALSACISGVKSADYGLYRRVETGKRIVLEVEDFREPNEGELIIAQDKTCILTANRSYNDPRTILRIVEGQEYLK